MKIVGCDFHPSWQQVSFFDPETGEGCWRITQPVVRCGQYSLQIFCLGVLLSVIGQFALGHGPKPLEGREQRSLGEVELQLQLAGRDFADVGMRPAMVAYLVPVGQHPLHHADIFLGFLPDHEEGRLHVLLLENFQDLRRPVGIGAIVVLFPLMMLINTATRLAAARRPRSTSASFTW